MNHEALFFYFPSYVTNKRKILPAIVDKIWFNRWLQLSGLKQVTKSRIKDLENLNDDSIN